jgi:sialate O-acetylesterase
MSGGRTVRQWAVAALVLLIGADAAQSEIRLPKLVGDHMVLQRDAPVRLWGWAEPGEPVQIDFQGLRVTARAAADGRWEAVIGPYSAGGPYEMSLHGRNQITLHDILIGDVWLASGQSNMEFPLQRGEAAWMTGVNHAASELANANHPRIRLFHVHHKIALQPAVDVEADPWTAATADTVGPFSAVAYLFGRELHERYQIPIGLIESNWGGTLAEAWVSGGGLKSFPEFQRQLDGLSHVDARAGADEVAAYTRARAGWSASHGSDDRGRNGGRDLWVAPDFDDRAWPRIAEPQTRREAALKGFDGAVWFRKAVELPGALQGQTLLLHLAGSVNHDDTYFNGEKIGETQGWDRPREYLVPGRLVRGGRNVIVVRQTGLDGYLGMFCEPENLKLEAGGTAIPLAGEWAYQPGPDLSGLPAPPAFVAIASDLNSPTVLFNGMIAPLTPYRIKGAIWYQGESNAGDLRQAEQYRTLFPALIEDWRSRWGYPLPFLFVQLAGFGPNRPEPAEYPWAILREAQAMTLALPHTGMATAVDLGDEHDIHPRNKQDLAHRLALVAAKQVYGENLVDSGPAYRSMAVEGDRIRIRFSGLGSGWVVRDRYGYVRGFEIAGADGRFAWAQARREGGDIVVFAAAVPKPVAVRYDWSNTPDGNLYNQEGFPALPFRTGGPGRPPSAP